MALGIKLSAVDVLVHQQGSIRGSAKGACKVVVIYVYEIRLPVLTPKH